jgi:sporulation protein YlmC with PRC-barrel domain
MIRTLLATTALATLLASSAYAANATTPATNVPVPQTAPTADQVVVADGSLATKIIGASVYNGTGDNAENIGEVKDIVISKDGKAQSLVIAVGGFLGIGEKNVAYDFSKAKWAEKDGKRWLVAPTTKEDLKAKPNFDTTAYDTVRAPASANNTIAPVAVATAAKTDAAQNAPATATSDASATDQTSTAAINKSTLTEMPMNKIRVKDLVGTTVYDADDASVGEIGDVVLTPDKKADSVIIDVGGFLGIGEKEVAVGMDNLKFMTDKNGNKYLYTNFTKEQLKAQPAYDKSTYAQKRDEQRLVISQ